jgi:hypothetical protein
MQPSFRAQNVTVEVGQDSSLASAEDVTPGQPQKETQVPDYNNEAYGVKDAAEDIDTAPDSAIMAGELPIRRSIYLFTLFA